MKAQPCSWDPSASYGKGTCSVTLLTPRWKLRTRVCSGSAGWGWGARLAGEAWHRKQCRRANSKELAVCSWRRRELQAEGQSRAERAGPRPPLENPWKSRKTGAVGRAKTGTQEGSKAPVTKGEHAHMLRRGPTAGAAARRLRYGSETK